MSPEKGSTPEERERWRRATGYWMPDPDPPREDTLLLSDYNPHWHTVVADTTPERAKFTTINAHCHFFEQDAADLVREMDASNVEIAVNMGVGTDWSFDEIHRRYVVPHPDRFILFASLALDDLVAEPNFGALAAEGVERAVDKGAKGLKLWKNLGLTVRLPSGELLAIDDERLDPVYEKCRELDIPICFHTVDPPAFHEPLDRHNERYQNLVKKPDWHFHGSGFPDRDDVLEQRNRVIARYPDVTFFGAHMAGDGSNLPRLAELFDRFPNFHVDMSARIRDLGPQPYSARRFFIKYSDRVLFGTDGAPTASHSRAYFRFLETDDERWRQNAKQLEALYGIHLPDDVLEKVYRTNARRVLKLC